MGLQQEAARRGVRMHLTGRNNHAVQPTGAGGRAGGAAGSPGGRAHDRDGADPGALRTSVVRSSQVPLRAAVHTDRMRILVVDDDRAVRESLRRSLAFNGYQVDLAVDGKEALDAVAQRRPDAMVLDVMMPRLDGLEVCRRHARGRRRAADPGAHRPRRRLRPGRRAWTPARTTTCPSRSRWRSCWPGCARCCAGAPPTTSPRGRRAAAGVRRPAAWTPAPARCSAASGRSA